MLHILDGPQHLGPDVFAAFDALEVTPGSDACFRLKPSLECFGKGTAVCAGVGNKKSLANGA
jgi:hypothetical protein